MSLILIIIGNGNTFAALPVNVHGDWTQNQQKTDLQARVQIKKLTRELEIVKKENEEYAKQAKYFTSGMHAGKLPQNGKMNFILMILSI